MPRRYPAPRRTLLRSNRSGKKPTKTRGVAVGTLVARCREVKWTPIFGPGVKVVKGACSITQGVGKNEEDTYEAFSGIQGQSRPGSDTRARHDRGAGSVGKNYHLGRWPEVYRVMPE